MKNNNDLQNGNNPLLIDLDDTKEKVKRIKVVKRGKGKLNPDTTPMNYVYQQFMLEQKGKGNTKKTIIYYENCYKKLIEFLINELPDKETLKEIKDANKESEFSNIITINMLELDNLEVKYRNYLLNVSKVSEITVDTYFRGYRAFAYYCMNNKWIEQRKISVKSTLAPIKDCYTLDEINRLLKKPNTDNFTEYRNWVIINYLLSCGNRLGSIVDLNIENIDIDECCANVNTQKNKRPVRVPLIKKICNILYEYITIYRTETEDGIAISGDRPLFCNWYGERLTEQGLYKAISDYNKSRGVNKTSLHLFRHTFAKDWIVKGGDLFSLQRMLGQSSLRMVQHYSNLYSSDVKEKAENFAMLANIPTTSGKTLKKNGRKLKR
jgi:integrase/recombinase XerD